MNTNFRIALDVLGDVRLRFDPEHSLEIQANPRLGVSVDLARPVALHETGVSRYAAHFALGHQTRIPIYGENSSVQHVLWAGAGFTRFYSGGSSTLRALATFAPQQNNEICAGAEWQSLIDFRQLNLGLAARAMYCQESALGSSLSAGLGLITNFAL